MQMPIKLPPKSCAHNARGIVRHSTLWLKPLIVGDFEYKEWTGDGHLRRSSFVSLVDKKAKDVKRES